MSPESDRSQHAISVPLSILKQSVKLVPANKYAFGVLGIVAAASLSIKLVGGNWLVALAGGVVMLAGMVILRVFSTNETRSSKQAHPPALTAQVLTWLCIVSFAIVLGMFLGRLFAFLFPTDGIKHIQSSKPESKSSVDVSKLDDLQRERERIQFEFENNENYIISPARRAGTDPETHQSNWAVRFRISTGQRLDKACVDIIEMTGPDHFHVDVRRRLGWQGAGRSFSTCPEIFDHEYFVLFHCQVFKNGREKLQLFSEPGDITYEQMRSNMKPGEYAIKLRLTANNISKPVDAVFTVDWTGSMKDFRMSVSP